MIVAVSTVLIGWICLFWAQGLSAAQKHDTSTTGMCTCFVYEAWAVACAGLCTDGFYDVTCKCLCFHCLAACHWGGTAAARQSALHQESCWCLLPCGGSEWLPGCYAGTVSCSFCVTTDCCSSSCDTFAPVPWTAGCCTSCSDSCLLDLIPWLLTNYNLNITDIDFLCEVFLVPLYSCSFGME